MPVIWYVMTGVLPKDISHSIWNLGTPNFVVKLV